MMRDEYEINFTYDGEELNEFYPDIIVSSPESKPRNEYFHDLLTSRENPFDIDEELKIKKILEHGLSYTIDLKKSSDKYEYDLTVYNYQIEGGGYKSDAIGFIEVEVSEKWIADYPNYWKTDSFLARKVLVYDHINKKFKDELKPKAIDTVYIIFNKNLTDCICCDMTTISTFEKWCHNQTNNPYNNWFLRESLSQSNKKVIRGIESCINYISNFLKKKL